ncbi:MAG: hypothetical protein IJ039_05780 [Clostridia bacterium]|nr:hypothetical protein [Clostridia bacterium]
MKLTFNDRMAVAAHRGDSYNYYENTMTAFKMAEKTGCDMIEIDVHLSLDEELIIIHDHRVDRTTNGCGEVASLTLKELKSLNAGDTANHEEIPTFDEFIKWVSETSLTVNIEIKEYWSEKNEARCILCIEKVLELVERYNLRDRVVINSFDAFVLEYVYKKYGKKYALHGFYPYKEMMNVSLNPDEYLDCACIFDNENKAFYDYLIERNIEPWVGASITQKSKLDICLKYGAKLITTNNPSDIIGKLRENK